MAAPGDTRYNLLWDLVECAGGIPRPGDSEYDLLWKYLAELGSDVENTPRPGDTFNDLLEKVLRRKGGTPIPGDNEWNLLVRLLATFGSCRACGDLVHTLWRKITEAECV